MTPSVVWMGMWPTPPPVVVLLLLSASRWRPTTSTAVLQPVYQDGSCEMGWFHCGDNGTVCVEQRFVCNREEDCPAGEDEHDCLDNKGDSNMTKTILKKPVYRWEERHRCSLAYYPSHCLCRIETRIHCKNLNLTRVPQEIDTNVTALLMGNNSIRLIPESFHRYPRLKLLHLSKNRLTSIPAGVFSGLDNLTKLFIANNKLSTQGPGTLEGLRSLSHLELLDLSHNSFRQLDPVLDLVPSLSSLWLNSNQVTLKGREVIQQAYTLKELFLENNLVEELTQESLRGLSELETLYLRHNKISVIHGGAFQEMRQLVDLELNYNRIQHLTPDAFRGLKSLIVLNMGGNPLVGVPRHTLRPLVSLDSLRLAETELSTGVLLNISADLTFGDLTPNVSHAYFKRFRYCGYLPRVPDCWPKTDGVSSFEHLLVCVELRVAVWLVALATLVGNLTVLGGRVLSRDDNKILSLFIRNLAVADLLTGLYLVVVATKDLQFRAEYHEHAYYWMTSWQCTVTGVLAMMSAEVSVLILSFMSVERWVCITWPLGTPKLSLEGAKVALACIWATGFLLSVLPVLCYRGKQRFYGINGLCFPLHLDDPWVPGWLYSALVFVGINQLGVVLILLSYTGMFCSIRRTRANTPLSLGDREFAMRFFFIVFTDCLCWTPIIILRILALADLQISPKLYAYVVVVLLPINSALNPFLYTFTTTKFRSQALRFLTGRGVCRWRPRRDSESEATRSSFFRTTTCKLAGGRDLPTLHNGASHTVDDSLVPEVSRVSLVRDEISKTETTKL
ncbi:relaxin receptor 2-like [Panulirus ornatus]|uniref:relaxin receptor 2-like n=1 Tax=Panulirus ornatus TaxID=150431 RepID=UPI003A8A7629